MLTGVPQPARLRGEPEHRLHHRQTQQLRMTQHRRPSRQPGDTGHIVVDLYLQCRHEGVQVCLHKPILDTLFACPQTLHHAVIN
jgi:hypothetical protein